MILDVKTKLNKITLKRQVIKINVKSSRGPAGPGLIRGGNTDEALLKKSNADFDTKWQKIDASFVGADPAGSADQALADAKTYTDTEVSALDAELAVVAKTGDYDDLSNKPTIPIVDYPVTSVNGQTNDVVLDTDDILDTSTNRYTNDTDIARLANTSGTNTGDQDLSDYATITALDEKYDKSGGPINGSVMINGSLGLLGELNLNINNITGANNIYANTFFASNVTVDHLINSGENIALDVNSDFSLTGHKLVSVANGTDPTDGVNKSQLDTGLALKRNLSTGNNKVYTTSSTGVQNTFDWSYNATSADTIPVRTSGGRLGVGTAVGGSDAVPKAQMDTAIAALSIGDYVRLDGTSTMTGDLSLGGPTRAINFLNSDGYIKMSLTSGLRITNANSTAEFRLLPSNSDIYFQNTASVGNIFFTSVNNTDLTGYIGFRTTNSVRTVANLSADLGSNGAYWKTAYINGVVMTSTSTGITANNVADQSTNYERVRQFWSGNIYNIASEQGGTGLSRGVQITSNGGNTALLLDSSSLFGAVKVTGTSALSGGSSFRIIGTLSSSSGLQYAQVINTTVSQSGTAGYTALLINPTETTTGSGVKLLVDAQVGGVSQFTIANNGRITATSVLDMNASSPAIFFTPTTGSQTEIRAGNGSISHVNRTSGVYMSVLNSTGLALFSSASIISPTHSLTLPSISTGIAIYNTTDQTTNFERLIINNNSNVFTLASQSGGTGIARNIRLETGGGTQFTVANAGSTSGYWIFNKALAGGATGVAVSVSSGATSGINNILQINPTITQSLTAGYNGLFINIVETSTGSGAKNLIETQVGGVSKFTVDNQGNLTANNVINSTTTKNITVSPTAPTSMAIGDIWVVV